MDILKYMLVLVLFFLVGLGAYKAANMADSIRDERAKQIDRILAEADRN